MVDVESQFSSRKCSVVLDIIVYRIQRILSSDRHTIKPSGVLEVNEIRHLVIIRLGVDGQPTSFPGKAEVGFPALFLLQLLVTDLEAIGSFMGP